MSTKDLEGSSNAGVIIGEFKPKDMLYEPLKRLYDQVGSWRSYFLASLVNIFQYFGDNDGKLSEEESDETRKQPSLADVRSRLAYSDDAADEARSRARILEFGLNVCTLYRNTSLAAL